MKSKVWQVYLPLIPRGMTPKKIKTILKIWKEKWKESSKTSPYPPEVIEAWEEAGFSYQEVREMITQAIAMRKHLDEKDPIMQLLRYSDNYTFSSEQYLRARAAEATAGQIFLLKAKHGYKETQNINIGGNLEDILRKASKE